MSDNPENGAPLAHILEQHRKNSLENSENQFRSASEFMEKVQYRVPLHHLYEVVASCVYTEGADFCPILVKIVDKTILEVNKGMRYLVQVWNSNGDLVFEKPLSKPVCNWNISNNKFIFLEDCNSCDIWLVKLFMDKEPVLYKLTLPGGIIKDRENTYYDAFQEKLVVPGEKKPQ